MTETQRLFERGVGLFGDRVHAIGADQWTLATPCSEWNVRALVNHLVVELMWVPPLFEGRTIEEVGDRFDGDRLGRDPVRTWDDAAAAALAAVGPEAALHRTVHLSYGVTPAADYVGQLTADLTVHAWDLARAIGGDETLDPELVEAAYDLGAANADQLAASGLFAAPVEVGTDADLQTRLLAAMGRRA